MSDPDRLPGADHLRELLADDALEAVVACLDQFAAADAESRKRAIRVLHDFAERRPGVFEHLAVPVSAFLCDQDRAVRLTTAKLFVALARAEPTLVRPCVESLAARLADDAEFYYVRARCAESLGYLALDSPGAVGDPEILADLLVGADSPGELPFPSDEPLPTAESDDDTPAFLADRLQFFRAQSHSDGPSVAPEAVGTVTSVREGTADAVEAMTSPDGDGCPHCGVALPTDGPPMCPRCGVPR